MKRNRSGDSGERRAYHDDDDDDGNALSTFRSATTAAVSMRMRGEGPNDEAGTQQRGGGLPRSQPGNKVTGPAWWAKLIEHYGEKQKNLAVNFAAEVDEITNAGHQKIVSDLLDKGSGKRRPRQPSWHTTARTHRLKCSRRCLKLPSQGKLDLQ